MQYTLQQEEQFSKKASDILDFFAGCDEEMSNIGEAGLTTHVSDGAFEGDTGASVAKLCVLVKGPPKGPFHARLAASWLGLNVCDLIALVRYLAHDRERWHAAYSNLDELTRQASAMLARTQGPAAFFPTESPSLVSQVQEVIERADRDGVAPDDGNVIDLLADNITESLESLRIALGDSKYASRFPRAIRDPFVLRSAKRVHGWINKTRRNKGVEPTADEIWSYIKAQWPHVVSAKLEGVFQEVGRA